MSRDRGTGRRGLPAPAAGLPVPADKRFRRSEVRPGRRRNWRRLLGKAAWVGGAGIAALGLAAWLGGALANASVLRVDHLVVRGNTRVSAADIESRLQGIRGEGLFRVDLEQYRQRLQASPWVASAELWRVLPSTVQVRIVERTPLAVARRDNQLHLVDAEGVLIDRFGPQYRQFDLPIVDGLVTETASGPVVDPARIRLVSRLLRDLSARPDLLQRVSQVNVSDPRNAVVLLEGEPAELRLGDEKFLERLERWETIAVPMREQQPISQYWELRFDDHVVWVK